MFLTPDFGHSDIWHFNFALKYLLSIALKNGYFPLWSKNLGTGFPLLGEGQIGMFNFTNIIFFRLFDPVIAFNFSVAFIILTIIVGSYLYGRVIKLTRLASFYLGIIFAFSGVFVVQITHFNLIQAASFLPLQFFLVEKYLQSSKIRWLLVFSFIIQQQIFAGFQQLSMICLLGLAFYTLARCIQLKSFSKILIVAIFNILGLIFALPQLIASAQFTNLSFRQGGLPITDLAAFPFNPKSFITFIAPYFWGDPRIGTYPTFSQSWGIFWESCGYVGIIPLVLSLFSITLIKKSKNISFFFFLLVPISAILLIGKFSPLFFVLQIPPLSYFRVPARFLFLFDWGLLVLSAIILSKIKNKVVVFCILLAGTANILYFTFTYHAWTNDPNSWLQKPEIVNILEKDPSWYRVYSPVPVDDWNKIFLKTGWKDINNYYQFRNVLDANQNLYWNIASADFYTGLAPRRLTTLKSLVDTGISINETSQSISISSASAKLLSISGVKYFISTKKLDNDDFPFIASVSGSPNISIYQNSKQYPHSYLTRNYEVVNNLNDLVNKLTDPNDVSSIVENKLPFDSENSDIVETKVIENDDLKIIIEYKTDRPALLVLSDTYYPGWNATINDKAMPIIPVNLNQRGVIVPPGRNRVVFVFNPLKIL